MPVSGVQGQGQEQEQEQEQERWWTQDVDGSVVGQLAGPMVGDGGSVAVPAQATAPPKPVVVLPRQHPWRPLLRWRLWCPLHRWAVDKVVGLAQGMAPTGSGLGPARRR